MNTHVIVSVFLMSGWSIGCSSNDDNAPSSGSGGTTSIGQGSLGGSTASGTNSAVGNGGTSYVSKSSGGLLSSGGVNASTSGMNGGTATNTGGTATNTAGTAGKGGGTNQGGTAGKGGSTANGTTSMSTGGTSSTSMASGCGVTGAITGVQNLTMQVAGQERAFVLSVPTTYSINSTIPIVFAWHGLGGSGTLARQYFGIEKASNSQAIFVYPTGLPNSSGQSAWTLTQTGIDLQFFDALLADISRKYCIDPTRVYSTGHSYGAMMTNALGCYRAKVLRGIAPVAGMPPFGSTTCAGAVAAFIAHGENDATVDYTTGGLATRDFWLKLDGCSATATPTAVEPSPCVAYQNCSAGHPVHWCVHQDNHNWPNFAATGIWAFFNDLK